MAEPVKGSELPALDAVSPDDFVIVIDDPEGTPTTRKVPVETFFGSAPILDADPAAPADRTWWVVEEGGEIQLRVRVDGETHMLAGLSLPT